jgi:mono/diheme cytochrome c family protein
MIKKYLISVPRVAVLVAALAACTDPEPPTEPKTGEAAKTPDFIEGQVVNSQGAAEAGVWVIAETDSLPTNFRKIVVTNDEGRFVLPELPSTRYHVWVRGYGLTDSQKLEATPGDKLSLKVEQAASAQEAASLYPANYWLSMMEAPSTEALKNAEHPYASAEDWLSQFKLNCTICHQPGSAPARAVFPSREATDYGLKKAGEMNLLAEQLNRDILLDVLENWGEKIAAGETPEAAPPRPEGIERNFVITQWEYGGEYTYAHDVISTDKRNPHLYPDEKIYGLDIGNDHLLVLDPGKHKWEQMKLPDYQHAKPWCEQTYKPLGGGEEIPVGAQLLGCPEPGVMTPHMGAYQNPVNPHNPMMDDTGKVWMTMQVRREWGEDLPEFCKNDPLIAGEYHHRQLGYYDTGTGEIIPIDTCFGTHHLQFDDNGVLWVNGDSNVIGWLDTKEFDPDKPETLETAQGWSEGVADTDGDGTPDKPIIGYRYSIIPNPARGDVWIAIPPGSYGKHPTYGDRGYITRYDPETGTHEAYKPPAPASGARGIDVDTKGNIWAGMAGSGHLARFDRSKCEQTWGAGDQCPEGWTLWETPGPRFKDAPGKGTNFHYFTWVDQYNTLGMGKDTVIINGTNSDSLIAFRPDTEEFTVIRIPYPMISYTRGVDGRIDQKDGGWKDRGLWFTNGLDPVFMSEIPRTYVGHVQLRPDPLAH